jgi:hypothetical protein
MDPVTVGTVVLLTTNDLARRVFEQIAQDRRVRLKDLQAEVERGKTHTVDAKVVQKVLDELEKNKLIARLEEQPGIDDFRTYYLTADGFATERKLRELGLLTSAG